MKKFAMGHYHSAYRRFRRQLTELRTTISGMVALNCVAPNVGPVDSECMGIKESTTVMVLKEPTSIMVSKDLPAGIKIVIPVKYCNLVGM